MEIILKLVKFPVYITLQCIGLAFSLSFTLITLMGLALEMSLATSLCDSHLSSPLPEALWEDDSVIRWIAFLHKQMSGMIPTALLLCCGTRRSMWYQKCRDLNKLSLLKAES